MLSAALDVTSTNKGLLIPRVASTGDVMSPTVGLMVYQTGGTAGFYFYNGSWNLVGGGGDNLGNHTATTNLNMANFDITNVKEIMPARLRFNINQTAHTFTSSNVHTWNSPATLCQVNSTNIPTSHTNNTVVKFTSTMSINMHGFPAGVDGQLLMLMVTGSTAAIQVNHQSTSYGQVAGPSQFWNPENSNPVSFVGPGYLLFMYDSSLNSGIGAWMILSRQP